MFKPNPILDTDSYKHSHFLQYPFGTSHVSSYIESRGCDRGWTETVVFGIRNALNALRRPVTQEDIDNAAAYCEMNGVPFNRVGWEHLLDIYQGVPLKAVNVRAVQEGTVLPIGNVMFQIVNKDPAFYWLPSFLETQILRAIWYPTTVATLSYQIKKSLIPYMKETCDDLSKLPYMLNDFGSRGVSSYESSVLGGMGHLLSFSGTDNMPALQGIMEIYGDDKFDAMSLPAAEHSTMTSWGKDREAYAYKNMIDMFSPEYPVIAVVSDSYNIFNACEKIWGEELKRKVEKCGSTIVVRPDSGDVLETLKKVMDILLDKYGYMINTKGYKVLPSCIRVIQGDGITESSIRDICEMFKTYNWSLDNIVFGMGGGLLQQVNRDTLKFAMKCSAVKVINEWKDVWKDPVGGGKTSKRGRLQLIKDEYGEFKTVPLNLTREDFLIPPDWHYDETFASIKERVDESLIY